MSEPRLGRAAGAGLGLVGGLVSGLLGVGGGLVVVPALALAGVPLRTATGTALGIVVTCALCAVAAEALTEPAHLAFLPALAVAAGGQLGIPLGRRILGALPDRGLRLLLVAVLLLVSARSLGLFGAAPATAQAGVVGGGELARLLVAGGAGVFAGVSAVLFGIGGGILVVPALVFLAGGWDFREATAISLLAMIPTAVVSLRHALREGRVATGVLAGLLPAGAVGAVGGVVLRNRALEPQTLATLFGGFLLYAAVRLHLGGRKAAA